MTAQVKAPDACARSADTLVRVSRNPQSRTKASALLSPPGQLRISMRNAFFGLLVVYALTAAAQAQTRVATVDVSTLWTNYWKRSQGNTAVHAQMADKKKQFDGMVAHYNELLAEHQKLLDAANDQAVSAQERARRQEQADAKQQEIRDAEDTLRLFKKQSQEAVEEQMTRMRQSILDEIFSVAKANASAGNYNLLIDSSAPSADQTPVVLYANTKRHDLTGATLKQLNSTAPPDFVGGAGSATNQPDSGPAR